MPEFDGEVCSFCGRPVPCDSDVDDVIAKVWPYDVPPAEGFWSAVEAKLPEPALTRMRAARERGKGFEGPLSIS